MRAISFAEFGQPLDVLTLSESPTPEPGKGEVRLRSAPIVLMLMGMAISNPVAAQQIQTGFLDRSVVLDGTEYRYQVFIPRNYQASRAWPVVLALHGGRRVVCSS